MIKVKVKAVSPGFFAFYKGKRRYPGDVLRVDEGMFSNSWMMKIEPEVLVEAKAEIEPEVLPEVKPKVIHKAKSKPKHRKEEGV